MQNNVTELTQRLLRALDSNYNVIDMPAVIEVVSLLEKAIVTKEVLEATRLGRHVNELRRKTGNDSLSKRAKDLVKKWRTELLSSSSVPVEPNGQLKRSPGAGGGDDYVGGATPRRKRLAKDPTEGCMPHSAKRSKANGQQQLELLDLSDNSNSSFKDVITSKLMMKRDVILINSDSNSNESMPFRLSGQQPPLPPLPASTSLEPQLEEQLPKKRGRKKGSKNHKNLLDEAESSFTNKLAVSRGNSKVKTTQELIAGLQNKNNLHQTISSPPLNSLVRTKEDLNVRAAKLTERVSIIDQKLNTNANRYKNSSHHQRNRRILIGEKSPKRVIESGSVINDKSLLNHAGRESESDEIIVVDDPPSPADRPDSSISDEAIFKTQVDEEDGEKPQVRSLSVEEAMAQLPPIDRSCLNDLDEEDEENRPPRCTCRIKENNDFSVADDDEEQQPFEIIEDPCCPARQHLEAKFTRTKITPEDFHRTFIENVNGNFGLGPPLPPPEMDQVRGLYANVVPNVNKELVPKDIERLDFTQENYKKYSISECASGDERTGNNVSNADDDEKTIVGDGGESESVVDEKPAKKEEEPRVFREWHEVLDWPSSYDNGVIKILPYVIID